MRSDRSPAAAVPAALAAAAAAAAVTLLVGALVAGAGAAGAQDTTTTTEVRRMVGEPLPIWVTLAAGAVLFVVILVVGNALRHRIARNDAAEQQAGATTAPPASR